MKKPLIAVVPSRSSSGKILIPPAYLHALRDAGAIGVTLPYSEEPAVINEYAEVFDGFLFSGGVDVDPIHYGEIKQFDSVEIDAVRDRFELLLMEAVADSGKPILGICRGVQLINVAFGGSLVQHMDGHRQAEENTVPTHTVCVEEDSKLYGIVQRKRILTNSCHHQAVKAVAPNFKITARAEDGTVEAIEHESRPFLLGVQWHPECFYKDQAHARKLFEAFVKAADA